MKIIIRLLLLFFTFPLNSCNDLYDSETGIKKDVLGHVKDKINQINKTNAEGGSFVFITDTHVTTNRLNSPQQIRYILQNTPINKVIWGGDAISAYGNNIEQQWEWHCSAFDDVIKGSGTLYKVRGNHDFTIRESEGSESGKTLSQHQTFQYLFEDAPYNIVRNLKDPDGCYYYFDDEISEIRYIILDTNDSLNEGFVPWGVINGVHDIQLDWVANTAIALTPKDYCIVFVSHIPITDTTSAYYNTYTNVLKLVNAVNAKGTGNIGTVYYNFSLLKNVRVLLYLSGHMHHDMQTYQNGVLHVITACDTAYSDYRMDPFVVDKSGRDCDNEQCFDCVCIDKNKDIISFIRVGVGGNRLFHLQPIIIKVGEKRIVNKTQAGVVFSWYNYDSSRNSFDEYAKAWTINKTIVSIDNQGMVKGIASGEAVILNMNEKGDKEFYNVIVEE